MVLVYIFLSIIKVECFNKFVGHLNILFYENFKSFTYFKAAVN